MIAEDLIISGRKRDLGGFTVDRILPSAQRRFVGPFVFVDHMGPMTIDATHVLDVRPHPHIGLSTVTYLFEGRGYHRDSIGSRQMISPGDLNWMTAGKGIVHSERTPEEDRNPADKNSVHGVQIWVGLPLEFEETEASFTHYPSAQMPTISFASGLFAKLLIGTYGNARSPVKTFSRAFFMDVQCEGASESTLVFEEEEIGILLITGTIEINGKNLNADDMILVANPRDIKMRVEAGTRLVILGGTPFPEPRHIWWNFVSSSKERIHQAAAQWKNQEFGKVPGENDFIPLPEFLQHNSYETLKLESRSLMKSSAQPVYILGSARIPFAKSQTAYAHVTRKDLMLGAMNALVGRYNLKNQLLGDVALGAVMNSSSDFNLAREVLLSTAIHPDTPAYNVQRACGTGLETIWQIALKAHTGAIDLGIGGGVDTNSDLPIEVSRGLQQALLELNKAATLGQKIKALSGISLKSLRPAVPSVNEPRTHKSMGDHCELMVKEWQIPREAQDALALASHKNSAKAYDAGFYDDLVQPFQGLKRDGTLRGDTSIEKLAKLKPAFDTTSGKGTLTAGNSSPLTDGAACALVGNQAGADKIGAKPLAKIIDVQVAAVDFVHGAGLLMAPTKAIAQLLTRNKLTPADFDYFELHEAFAGQVLCNLKAMETEKYCREVLGLAAPIGVLDPKKINVVGSSLALGHPFAATGARIAGTLAKLLSQGGNKRGLISICTAGGMGIAAIMESV